MTQPAFIITTGRTPGARLSLCGQWGNVPFVTAEAAEVEARRLGAGSGAIRWERGR